MHGSKSCLVGGKLWKETGLGVRPNCTQQGLEWVPLLLSPSFSFSAKWVKHAYLEDFDGYSTSLMVLHILGELTAFLPDYLSKVDSLINWLGE